MRRLRCLIRGCCRLRARSKGQGARRKGKEQGARGKEKRYLTGSSICAIYVLMHRCDVASLRGIYHSLRHCIVARDLF